MAAEQKKVKTILAQVRDLPAMPRVLQQVMTMVKDPDFSFRQLMEVVRVDPGITSHVLRYCNSPFFGLVRKISSLEEALTYLGAKNVVEIVLSSQLVGHYRNQQEGYRLARGELWRHSMATGLLSHHLAQRANYPEPATLFTACLLHDVGKLILSQYVQREFAQIEALVEQGLSFAAAEHQVIGMDHGLLGGVVARNWNFPTSVATAIAYHHNIEGAKNHRQLTALVSLTNLLCVSLGVGGGADGLAATFAADLLSLASINRRDLDSLILELGGILAEAKDLLDMAG